MLARSPVVASANASPRSSFPNIGSHYAPASSSPRQSSPRVLAVAKSSRQSTTSSPAITAAPIAQTTSATVVSVVAATLTATTSIQAAAESASTEEAPQPKYVGVDAATQYSPMEPINYATGEPLHAKNQESAENEQVQQPPPPPPPPTSGTHVMAVSEDRPAVAAVAHSTPGPSKAVPTAVVKKQLDDSQHPASPSKRRNSEGPGSAPAAPADAVQNPSTLNKRARPETPTKVLPRLYEHCSSEDMVDLIAHMLGELIETNDALALKTGALTRFHSRTAPGISVSDYLHRLAKHATLTPPLLLSMVYYIDRLCALYSDFTINTLTVHRFLITAATVAAKGLSDAFWNNSTYARVGGVRLAELKLLELEFLYRVDWRIVPNPEVLVAYYKGLVERCPGYSLQSEDGSNEEEEEGGGGGGEDDEDDSDVIDDEYDDDDDEDEDVEEEDTAIPGYLASVYIQPVGVGASDPPTLLAEIRYDVSFSASDEKIPLSNPTQSSSEVLSYEAPELSEDRKLVRVGVYDPAGEEWVSSTSVASVDNFGKGYSPHFVLTVDGGDDKGEDKTRVVAVGVKGVRIDAGQTRDFGPQVLVRKVEEGARPQLGKPVVLDPEGKKVVAEEKTFFQKYWWALAIGAVLLLGGGGDGK
ncbi:cyclin-domain-containing protein [Podospora australis]|uniref:Cyclin-domain-containing protein n=1 Tax=Podospora australis TaxID=1536484 RepID=A0AAN6WJT5_9PEZI|nr:cyclin-domain-containing protein [Podospora australis]